MNIAAVCSAFIPHGNTMSINWQATAGKAAVVLMQHALAAQGPRPERLHRGAASRVGQLGRDALAQRTVSACAPNQLPCGISQ